MKIFVALLGSLVSVAFVLGQTPTEKAKTDETTPPPKPKTVIRLDDPAKTTPATKAGTATTKAGAATKPGTATPASKTPAATKAGPKAADKSGAKKDEPPPKIEGMEVARPGEKGFLGVEVTSATFKVNFYDAKKKPVAPDVAYAVLRWNPTYQRAEERIVLNAADKALTSPRSIRPPYNFKLYITLFAPPAEGADPVPSENYMIDFRQ